MMRTSALVLSPILILLSPILLMVALSFSTVAMVTSILALVIICIRLGFLVLEFSGGVVFDVLYWGAHKYVLSPLSFLYPVQANLNTLSSTHPSSRSPSYVVIKDASNLHNGIRPNSNTNHAHYATPLEPSYNYLSNKKRYSSTHKRRGSKKNIWEKDALNDKLASPEGLDKLSGDALATKNKRMDGLWMGNVFDVKRPLSKRSVSGYM
jgi:hypothetical protein